MDEWERNAEKDLIEWMMGSKEFVAAGEDDDWKAEDGRVRLDVWEEYGVD